MVVLVSPSAARLEFSTSDVTVAWRVRVVNVTKVFVLITLGHGSGSEMLIDGVAFGVLGGTGVEIDGATLI